MNLFLLFADNSELEQFGLLFRYQMSHGFSEHHTWFSVWERPQRSRFTRVQRLTCCVTLIYTFMCVNAIWYGIINTPTKQEIFTGTVYDSAC